LDIPYGRDALTGLSSSTGKEAAIPSPSVRPNTWTEEKYTTRDRPYCSAAGVSHDRPDDAPEASG
jgi:hypothetical protein